MIINIFQHDRQRRKRNEDTASFRSRVSEIGFSERQINTTAARLYRKISQRSQRYQIQFQMI